MRMLESDHRMKFGVGQALVRKEDDPLVRGAGRYVADFAPAESGHAVVLRSPHAHARFRIADMARAEAMPGIRCMLTGADTTHLGLMPCVVGVPGQQMIVPPCPVLALDEVHHVGDAVAFVVADTLDQARDAPKPSRSSGSRCRMWSGPRPRSRRARRWSGRTGRAISRSKSASATAAGPKPRSQKPLGWSSVKLVNQRLVTNYIDTRGVIAQYDPERDHYTLTLGSQGSHAIRDIIGVQVMGLAARTDAGHHARCRRRLRYQAVRVSRICARRGGGKAHRQAGEMGRRPHRAFSRRYAWPRQHHHRAARARCGGPFPRARCRHHRRYGRVSVDLCAVYSLYRRGDAAGRLRHPGLLHSRARGLYQHRAGRCLSRRRAAGGVLCDRAAGRCGGARDRCCAGRDAAAKFHPARADAVRHGDRQDL